MNIAIMGYGNIGTGVAAVLRENAAVIHQKAGQEIKVRYILDIRDFPDDPLADRVVHDLDIILKDPEVDVVVETMGGTGKAAEFVEKALRAGKSVVTSNKDMVAEFGVGFEKLAAEKGVFFNYEAAVGGSIPIIHALRQSFVQEQIIDLKAVINGTTNFILTMMEKKGVSMQQALAVAQQRGFAEQDPSNDVSGKDPARKLAILMHLAYNTQIDWKQIPLRGVGDISKDDIWAARLADCSVKLVAHTRREGNKLYAAVEPMMLSEQESLASVVYEYNGIMVRGNMLDDQYFVGKGAGSHPTGSAVVSDLIEIALAENKPSAAQLAVFSGVTAAERTYELASFYDVKRPYLIRTDRECRQLEELPGCRNYSAYGIYCYRVENMTYDDILKLQKSVCEAGMNEFRFFAMEEDYPC